MVNITHWIIFIFLKHCTIPGCESGAHREHHSSKSKHRAAEECRQYTPHEVVCGWTCCSCLSLCIVWWQRYVMMTSVVERTMPPPGHLLSCSCLTVLLEPSVRQLITWESTCCLYARRVQCVYPYMNMNIIGLRARQCYPQDIQDLLWKGGMQCLLPGFTEPLSHQKEGSKHIMYINEKVSW